MKLHWFEKAVIIILIGIVVAEIIAHANAQ